MNDQNIELLGNFIVPEAKYICELLEKEDVEFQLEKHGTGNDRSGMVIPGSYRGGTFGFGITMDIYVRSNDLERCEKLIWGSNISDNSPYNTAEPGNREVREKP